jgi:aminoglycoside 6'-N-acetyltransferase I
MHVRPAKNGDLEALVKMRCALWPDETSSDHEAFARAVVDGRPASTLPVAIFVAAADDGIVGFVDVALRSHADGCDERRAVGFLEGWYVVPGARRRGVGRALIKAAEQWSRQQGCAEMASDTWIDAKDSQRAHLALGFEVVDRCVHFRKTLGSAPH